MNLAKINNQYAFLFQAAEKDFRSPFVINPDAISLTISPKDVDAFNLNKIRTNAFTFVTPTGSVELGETANGLVLRLCINYSLLAEMENNFAFGCLVLSTVINTLKSEAYRRSPKTMFRPNSIRFRSQTQENEYITELPDFAGCEVRLYVEF